MSGGARTVFQFPLGSLSSRTRAAGVMPHCERLFRGIFISANRVFLYNSDRSCQSYVGESKKKWKTRRQDTVR